jgi:RNA polymerase sigma-70 factor (ECF subfamily)
MDSPSVDQLARDVVLAQDGDPKAFRRVVHTVEPEIRRFSAWLMGNSADLDDIVQETLLRIHRGIDSFRMESHAISWVLSIARRVCLDYLRQTDRQQRLVLTIEQNTFEATHTGDADAIHILELVQSLPVPLKEVFVLVKLFGFSYAEVSEIVQTPIGTVQSRVARARVALADMILNEGNSSKTA